LFHQAGIRCENDEDGKAQWILWMHVSASDWNVGGWMNWQGEEVIGSGQCPPDSANATLPPDPISNPNDYNAEVSITCND
jgi:hypothetical protein